MALIARGIFSTSSESRKEAPASSLCYWSMFFSFLDPPSLLCWVFKIFSPSPNGCHRSMTTFKVENEGGACHGGFYLSWGSKVLSQNPHKTSPWGSLGWQGTWLPLELGSHLSWAHSFSTWTHWVSVSSEMLRALWKVDHQNALVSATFSPK